MHVANYRFHVKTVTYQNGDTHITRTATPRIPKWRHSINPKRRQSRWNEGTTIAHCRFINIRAVTSTEFCTRVLDHCVIYLYSSIRWGDLTSHIQLKRNSNRPSTASSIHIISFYVWCSPTHQIIMSYLVLTIIILLIFTLPFQFTTY